MLTNITLLNKIISLTMPVGKDGQPTPEITYDVLGTPQVTLYHVVKLMQLAATVPPVTMKTQVVDGNTLFTLTDGANRQIIIDMPLRMPLRQGTMLFPRILHLPVCPACGQVAQNGRGLSCGCQQGWEMVHFTLTPGQQLAAYLLDTDEGDSRLDSIYNTANSRFRGGAGATRLLNTFLRRAFDQLPFPAAPGLQRLADGGLKCTKVRNSVPTLPQYPANEYHPAMGEALSHIFVADHMRQMGFAISATSPSKPGEMYFQAGEYGRPDVIEGCLIGAVEHMSPGRDTPAAQALSHAVTLLDNDTPPVLPEGNPGIMPGGRCIPTLIMAHPSNVEDMIGVHPSVYDAFLFEHVEAFRLNEGDVLKVEDGKPFFGRAVLAVSADGQALVYDSVEHCSYAHMVEIVGDTHPDVQIIEDEVVNVIVAKAGAGIIVRTIRRMDEASKLSDGPNKGETREFTDDLFVNFCGEMIQVGMLLNPKRASAEGKFKAASIIAQAHANQLYALAKRYAPRDVDAYSVVPRDITNDLLKERMAQMYQRIARQVEDEGREMHDRAALESALTVQYTNEMLVDPSNDEETRDALRSRLGFWPVYKRSYEMVVDTLTNVYTCIGDGLFDPYHFWMLQPQLCEVNNGLAPVGRNSEMVGADGNYRFSANTSRSGGAVLEVERGHLDVHAPEIAAWIFDGREDPSYRMLGEYYRMALNIKPDWPETTSDAGLEAIDFATEEIEFSETPVNTSARRVSNTVMLDEFGGYDDDIEED